MLKAYKYRLYPTNEQKEMFAKHFGCVRVVYNWGLAEKKRLYAEEKKSIGNVALTNRMRTELKTQQEWLNQVNSQSLQMSLRNLDSAYTRFFKEKKGFPKFKSKKDNHQSFQCPQFSKVDFENSTLSIVKISDIKIVLHRRFEGNIKTVTISKTASEKYYASILIENNERCKQPVPISEETAIGIDTGIKSFAVCSNGEVFENRHYLKKTIGKLAFLQKRHSRKKRITNENGIKVNSHNREKSRKQIARLHEKISNQRLDYIHKITSKLVNDNQIQTICIEDLHIKGMQRNQNLSQSINDVSIGKFYEILSYKCQWQGINLLKIGRFEPSSKMCSCGAINKELKLSDRKWTCKICGKELDRDLHAADTIKKIALKGKIVHLGR